MISIIVPIYNCEKYLSQCIESLIFQTYKDIEIILVNDGSPDLSANICKDYAKKDLRIKYIEQVNQGVSVARNTGIENATGDFIMFVDSDDWLPRDAIEVLYAEIKTRNIDLVIGSYATVCGNKKIIYSFGAESIFGTVEIANMVAQRFLTAIISSPCIKIFRMSKINNLRFNKNMSLGEDLYFNLHYFKNISSIRIITDCCYFYRIDTAHSLTKSYKESYYQDMLEIYKFTNRYLDDIECIFSIKICRRNIAYKLFSFGVAFAVRQLEYGSSSKECIKYLKKIGNDSFFVAAMYQIDVCSIKEKLIIQLFKYKLYRILFFAIKYRELTR